MKLHRIFIAISLQDETKEQLLAYKNKWPGLPARWTTAENLHLTLAFLGNTSDQELAEVCQLMQKMGARHQMFSAKTSSIVYGPFDFDRGKPPKNPRMIWVTLEKSETLAALQKDIEKTLGQGSNPSTSIRTSKFSAHVTLARLKTFQLQRMEAEEIPEIAEEISLSFDVQSIEIMESKPKRSGAAYTVCQSVSLRGS